MKMFPSLVEILTRTIPSKTETNLSRDVHIEEFQEQILKLKKEKKQLQDELSKTKKNIDNDVQKQLKRQKDRFTEIINSMSDALCVTDELGVITFANPVAAKLMESNSLLGENFYSFVKFESNSSQSYATRIEEDEMKFTKSQILRLIPSNGKEIPLKSSWSALKDENNKVIGQVIVFNDYSLELETNRRLEQARDRAVEMSKLKSEFLATMSHEIRTPLNGIISLVSLLELSNLDDEQKEDIKDLGASANQLLSIISNVLDLSKIESGKMYLDFQKFSIQHLMNDLSRIFGPQMQEKEIFFLTEIIGEMPSYILADYTRLKQVLVNLVSNSLKFTGYQGCIVLLAKAKHNYDNNFLLEFAVIDTGVGIPTSKIPSLFTPFVQADGSITRNYGGSGLGLSICKNLVDLMGGSIDVRSREGVGTSFNFTFSVEEPIFSQGSLTRLKAVKSNSIKRESRKATVLVVDDNPINLSTTIRYLEKYGLKTFSAKSGDEALEITGSNNLDLILLDLHLPTMSGYEVTRCIRDSELPIAKVPIIAVTADVLQGTEQACLDAGFNGFIAKPLNLLELVKSIDLIVGTEKFVEINNGI